MYFLRKVNDESCQSGIQDFLPLDLFHFLPFFILVKSMNNVLLRDIACVLYVGSVWIKITGKYLANSTGKC